MTTFQGGCILVLCKWSDWFDTIYTVCGAADPDYLLDPVIVTVSDVSTAPGKTITIPVTIADNPGFAGFTLCIDYDQSVMMLTNISKGTILNASESGAFTKPGLPNKSVRHI